MKPFTDVLREYRKGQLADEATDELAKVVKGVTETGQAGELTVKLKIKPQKGDSGIIIVSGEVVAKTPREALPDAIFYADDEGGLHRREPRQADMDTLFKQTGEDRDSAAG